MHISALTLYKMMYYSIINTKRLLFYPIISTVGIRQLLYSVGFTRGIGVPRVWVWNSPRRCTIMVYGEIFQKCFSNAFIITARLAKRAKVMFSLCVSVHRGGAGWGGGPTPQCIGSVGPPGPGPGPPTPAPAPPPHPSPGPPWPQPPPIPALVPPPGPARPPPRPRLIGNFWRWGARAVRLLRSRRRTVLFIFVFTNIAFL